MAPPMQAAQSAASQVTPSGSWVAVTMSAIPSLPPGRRTRAGSAKTLSLAAALLLGASTAMVYPTLIAAVSYASQPRDRARVIGVYRFWRDFGFVLGALIAGVGADATSFRTAIVIVAALTGASGLLVAATSWQPHTALRAAPAP